MLERQERLKEAVRMTLERSRSTDGLAEDILQKVVAEALRTYQSKVQVGVQDSVSDLLDDFKHKVTDLILEAVGNWHVPQQEPILFPKNCRFLYQRGKTTVVVMEEPPQCRTLNFLKKVISPRWSGNSSVQPLYLSLPYVVFVLVFQGETFASMECAFRQRALDSIDAELGKPLLPNIHDNLNVCMGNNFALPSFVPITTNAEKAVHWFWTTNFNGDLADRWDSKHIVDPRLMDGCAWERLSKDDPLFILSVPFQKSNRTIRQIMEFAAAREEEPDESELRHRVVNSVEGCAEEMFKRVLAYFKKTKFERHIPKDVSASIQDVISNVMQEVVDLMAVLQDQLDKLQVEVDHSQRKWEPRGQFWS